MIRLTFTVTLPARVPPAAAWPIAHAIEGAIPPILSGFLADAAGLHVETRVERIATPSVPWDDAAGTAAATSPRPIDEPDDLDRAGDGLDAITLADAIKTHPIILWIGWEREARTRGETLAQYLTRTRFADAPTLAAGMVAGAVLAQRVRQALIADGRVSA